MILDAGTNSGGFSFGPLGGTEEERGRGVNGINVVRASSTNHSPSDLQTSSSRGIKHPLLVRTIKSTGYHLGNETRASRSPCAVPRSSIVAESYPRFNFDLDPARQSYKSTIYNRLFPRLPADLSTCLNSETWQR